MADADKILLLQELNRHLSLLKKHEATKREMILKTAITQQARNSQQSHKSKSFQSYKVMKNQCHLSSFNEKYSFEKPSHLSTTYQTKGNRLYSPIQNFKSKYSLSKHQVSHINDFAVKRKNLNSNVSIASAKSVCNSKNDSIKIPCASSNESGKIAYNTKDFMKEIDSLAELLEKKTSSNSRRTLNSKLDIKKFSDNKQCGYKKDQHSAFESTNLMTKTALFPKTKNFVETQLKLPAINNHANRVNSFMNSNIRTNPPQQKDFSLSKSIYKKSNVKQSLIANTATSMKNVKNRNVSMNGFENTISRSTSRTVIFSDCRSSSHDVLATSKVGVLHKKPSEITMKLHTPKIIFSSRKNLKKSPHVNKIKSPVFLKLKSSYTNNIPRVVKLKQMNTKYTKINKRLTPPNKKVQLAYPIQHKSSLKKNKKKVNNKYKVINKTPTTSSSKKTNVTCASVDKRNKTLSMDCDTFLETLNDSAVEKLEKNLLAISSELTTSHFLEKNENSKSNGIKPFVSKSTNKRTHNKKFKSRISKYKIINSSASQKFSIKSMQIPRMLDPVKREKAVLVRRLFKSKNVIINKNASPTSYSARLIKSKYLSLNKRKSSICQKYVYPAVSQHPKFKGSYSSTSLHRRHKQLKNNATSGYHSRLNRKASYGHRTYPLTYKNNRRCVKNKINNRFAHTPVVFIQGSRYAINLNGKTLKKLPVRGHIAKNFHRTSSKLFVRTPENSVKTFPTSANFASRVLHRSINRILTASSKKKLSKVNSYCMFYNRFGRCNRGVKCTYVHDPSKIAVCTRFLRGTCKTDGCPFSHEIDPGKMAICSFFLVGQCDKGNCPYRHEKLSPNAVLCKDFVQGYCYYGKECKKAHILICPKYMQGECDKGSSCTFPHPPQKTKKNMQEEVADEETKPAEVLLEKVLRYFQQVGDSQNKLDSPINLFVPKQRKLEQQPSFIPLKL